LARIDANLAVALRSGDVRLLDADVLRSGALTRMERRQALEAREAIGERIYLPPAGAEAALLCEDRRVAFLTYGWRTRHHPDPDELTLAALSRALSGNTQTHVVGVFWDYACLHQWPREPEEDAKFKRGLDVMACGYASPLGTTVFRRSGMPPLPAALAGIAEFKVPCGMSVAALRAQLDSYGVEAFEELDLKMTWDSEVRYRVAFSTHAQAAAAVQALHNTLATCACGKCTELDIRASLAYNDRPYEQRGWCIFESAVSLVFIDKLGNYSQMKARLDGLPPKMVEIGEAPDVSARVATLGVASSLVASATSVGVGGSGGVDGRDSPTRPRSDSPSVEGSRKGTGRRSDAVREQIRSATFSNGVSDKERVVALYDDFSMTLSDVMAQARKATAEKQPRKLAHVSFRGTMKGMLSEESQKDFSGQGKMIYGSGTEYVGGFERTCTAPRNQARHCSLSEQPSLLSEQ
jgi:hypothetical protein